MHRTLALLLALAPVSARAHDWYPQQCCSSQDCHQVPCEEIHASGGDFIYKGYHFPKFMVAPAPDGACHVCIATAPVVPTPRCIFLGGQS